MHKHFHSSARLSFALVAMLTILSLMLNFQAALAQTSKTSWKFDFGTGQVEPGYTQVLPATTYSKERGYGFEPGANIMALDRGGPDALRGDFCTSDKPFFFSVALPEGNYQVTVTLGDQTAATTTTIKAELRRLMLEKVQTTPGQFATRTFSVNVRTPQIAGDGEVHLKAREKTTEMWNWDDKLTLEFNDARPCVCALEIEKVDTIPTVFLLGDSTVCDQPLKPWNSWGQMLPRFFKPGVAVANHAESGESLRSSLGAKRLDKVLSSMKAGDYLFIQYGHNDMKEHGVGVGAFTTYKADLKHFVTAAREHGGIPVLVTSMHRKSLNAQGKINNTLGDYPAAVRQLAGEEKVPLIDLNAMSQTLYEALGPKHVGKAFQDGTHHNNYGSYELAKCVVEGIRTSKLDLAKYIADDFPVFDPAHPDPVENFHMPASPMSTNIKPEGN
ncbi:MAG: hypothetical protein JO316_26440 [Abitibacteriaceae bacterium]|nr:hypothetical protein [Abditibacteriaceae bacterium]